MANLSRRIWRIHIKGVVQSVGFRPFIKNLGDEANLKGFVRNLGDAGVEILIQSDIDHKDRFIDMIYDKLPELAVITGINVNDYEGEIEFKDQFEIKPSSKGKTSSSGFSAIPPDISICTNCSQDIMMQNRRIDYPFTSCTDCGPRYATIFGLPYDRPFTSFNDFPLCKDCMKEYTKPSDRRFHAQTTCCENCGPRFTLHSWENRWSTTEFSWQKIVDLLQVGKILTVMGLSGAHFVIDAFNNERISEFRKLRRKKSDKPFAVMMKDIDTVKRFCEISAADEKIIQSARKPIIILPTKDPSLWTHISPGLDSLGVMLPYTSFHHILFRKGAPSVLVMTSANLPGIPMPITPNDVLKASESISDLVLTHNRRIIQRNDDSVLRSHLEYHLLIRRARGYTPQPFYVSSLSSSKEIIAFGGEENNTVGFHKAGWILPSQHLGHITNLESEQFQTKTIRHLKKLFQFKPEIVLSDLHPDFLSTRSANSYALENDLPSFSVQHHVAHAASLALDNNLGFEDSTLTWVCDGYGYGSDGNAWGGELIQIENGNWNRVSSLIPMDYDGGDQNAINPGRMLLQYFKLLDEPLDFFNDNVDIYFPRGQKELDFLVSKNSKPRLLTTSLGRLLDSFAILLGVSNRRTYRGEPAIKLEGLATRSKNEIEAKSYISTFNSMPVIDNLSIMEDGIKLSKSNKSEDVAMWVHRTIGLTMGTIISEIASKKGIMNVGFSGGVAYNKLITDNFKAELVNNNLQLLVHNNIPPGDGGISTGQIYYHGVLANE